MRFSTIITLLSVFLASSSSVAVNVNNSTCSKTEPSQNNCVSFTVSSGTGCAWMCNYCANQLGTNNYYFVDGVCTYQSGGCVGSPQAGKQYSCCSV